MPTLSRVRWSFPAACLAMLVSRSSWEAQSGWSPSHQAVTTGLPRYDPSIREKDQAAKAAAGVPAPRNSPAPIADAPPGSAPSGTNEKPSDGAMQLPTVTVNGVAPPKPPVLPRVDVQKPVKDLPGEPLESPSARDGRLIKKHLGIFDRKFFNRFSFLGASQKERAREAEAVELKGRQLNDLAAQLEFSALAGQDPAQTQKIRDEFMKLYYSGPAK